MGRFFIARPGGPVEHAGMRYTLPAFVWLASFTALLADDVPTIPLHVTIISDSPEATAAFTEENIAWIAQNLNEEFKSGDGQQQARFEIRATTDLSTARAAGSMIFGIEDQKVLHSGIKSAIKDPLFKPDMVNIFVFYSNRGKMTSNGGNYCAHRTRAGNKTTDCYAWVLLDWQALQKKNSRILLHETGHVFSLKHVIALSSDKKSPENNVMTADKNPAPIALPEGESGYYFTPSQVEMLREKMQMLLTTFSRAASGEALVGR